MLTRLLASLLILLSSRPELPLPTESQHLNNLWLLLSHKVPMKDSSKLTFISRLDLDFEIERQTF